MTSGPALAILGSAPAFPDGLPFVRPPLPELDKVMARVRPSHDQGIATNGPLVKELERDVAERLGVKHAIAVSSGTAGLMLVLREIAAGKSVVLPSFTFSASAHAVAWNGARPVFAECDPSTFQLDVADAERHVGGDGVILATHVFGAPCAPNRLAELAASTGATVVFDAAAAFGAMHRERAVGGFGLAEVFSLTPTKTLTAAEGGLVTTNDDALLEAVRIGRDYGNPGDYDTRFVGLSARMSELHAAFALESLNELDANLARRREIADRYSASLRDVDGVGFQEIPSDDRPTWKDFTITIDPAGFGIERDLLASALRADGVDTRCYFSPPVHRQRAYADEPTADLPVTDAVAASVLSLPIYPALTDETIDRIAGVIRAAHEHADAITAA